MPQLSEKQAKALGKRLIAIGRRIEGNFDQSDWTEVGLLTGHADIINQHSRLLRSLSFGDSDYFGCVLDVMRVIGKTDPAELDTIEQYLDERYPGDSEYVSAKPSARTITFAPNVFKIPEGSREGDLVAVMLPLSAEFRPVFRAIKSACDGVGLRCQKADDIWEESVIVQDIFNLIFRAGTLVVDFTGKNPNVMYETGIAHTLGKWVIPITQAIDHVPFDLKHHRVLKYAYNREGLVGLATGLKDRLKQVALPF